MKEEFIKFLRKHGLLRKFKKNLKECRCEGDVSFENYFKDTLPISYFMAAFTWRVTPEEHLFWEDIDYEWKRVLKNKID